MDKDIQALRDEVSGMKSSRVKEQNMQIGKEDSLKNDLNRVTNDYNKYKDNSQR